MLHAMIMAGGGGTRLWPRSPKRRPKQFVTVTGDRSLLQQAFDRLEPLAAGRTWIITGEAHVAETAHQLPGVGGDHIVGEPIGRDTAACIGLGAALIAKKDPGGVMVVTPADHVIEPAREFGRAVQVAALMAEESPNSLITFGIVPNQPATGYGYIKRGPQVANHQGLGVYRVEDFVEKPSLSVAQRYVSSGQYYWNSGIFVWRVATVLDALRRVSPQIYAAVSRIADAWNTPEQDAVLRREYPAIKSASFDREVMEKASERLVVQRAYRWDDVGSWLALERMNAQDADGNTVLATHAGLETKNCVIVGDPDKVITTIGVSNLVIVQDGDSILIADRNEEGTVKQLVDLLKQKGLEKYL